MFSHVDEFNDLPEPARTRAVGFYEELIQSGRSERDALRQARELVEKWVRERAPSSER